MSKICTACGKNGVVNKRAKWVVELGRLDHPPDKFLPDMNDLVEITIKTGKQNSERLIYYFAAQSNKMLNSLNINNLTPEEAYGNFENSGICKLNKHGSCKIIIRKPITYFVPYENKTYPAHIHYKIQTKNNRWSHKNYNVQI